MGSLRFRFADEEESADYVARLAADMQQYDPQDVLCGSYIYRSWRPDLVILNGLCILTHLYCRHHIVS